MFPELNRLRKATTNISVFRGLNRTDNTGFSRVAHNSSAIYTEFSDMKNLCSDDYPRLLTRKPRAIMSGVTVKSNLLAAAGKLIYVTEVISAAESAEESETENEVTEEVTEESDAAEESETENDEPTVIGYLRVGDDDYTIDSDSYDSSADHRITQYGNYVIIQPEKVYFNLSSHDFENIDFSLVSDGVSETPGEGLSTTELNVAKFNTGYEHRQVMNFRDFSIEKVALDDNGKPCKVNYIYEKANGLEDVFKQTDPSNTTDSDDVAEDWQGDYFQHWNTIKVGETVEAQGESPSGIYRCYSILPKGTSIDGTTYTTYKSIRQFVKIENYYVKISRTPSNVSDPPDDLFAGLKKGDWVKISGMIDSVAKPLLINENVTPNIYWNGVDGTTKQNYPSGFWGNYIEVLNNQTFKVYYADENCIVIKANLEKSVPYNGPMTISRVMPSIDSGMMLEVNNRLWACSSQNNEIYSSKQGDCTNWQAYGDGIATDSYAVTVGSEGVFTGIARQNDSVIFFKENWILKLYGTKPSNYALASYNVLGVEQGSEKSVVWVNGVLFYLSHMGVCQYSPGGQPVVISQKAFGYGKYKNGVAGRHRNKYYISAENESGTYELFVFDTDTGMWHKEDNTQMVDTVTYNNVLYFTDAAGDLVCADEKNNIFDEADPEVEEMIPWSFDTGNLYADDFGKKYISRIQLGIKADSGFKGAVYAQFENGGAWMKLRELHRLKREHSLIPVTVRRADFLKLRVKGEGRCQISGIQIEYAGGSSKVWHY